MNRARSFRPAESRLSSQCGRAGGWCLGGSEYFNWSWPFTFFVFGCTESNIRKNRVKQMGATLENTVYSDFYCAPQRLCVFLPGAPVVSDHGDIKSICLLVVMFIGIPNRAKCFTTEQGGRNSGASSYRK